MLQWIILLEIVLKLIPIQQLTASDNCGTVTVSQISGLPSGSNFPVGQTENIFVATDGGGNTDTCRFTVTVNDTSGPNKLSCRSKSLL